MRVRILILGLIGLVLGAVSFGLGLSGAWGNSTAFYAAGALLAALGAAGEGYAFGSRHTPGTAQSTQPQKT